MLKVMIKPPGNNPCRSETKIPSSGNPWVLESLAPLLQLNWRRTLLLFGLLFTSSAFAADDTAVAVTDELLRTLGLDREYHKCISVADGDTLTLEGLGTVRAIGVDTPEKNHPKLPVQFISKQAGNLTKKICLGKNIRLEYDPHDKDKRGNYGRILGYVYLEDGTFLQEALIKNGYATAYTKYPFDESRKAQFLAWEQAAQKKGVGLWVNNGFPEVLWILEHAHPLLTVTKISKGNWQIAFGNWILEPVRTGGLKINIQKLYSSIYELGPRDLQAKLREFKFKETSSNGILGNNLFVIGMAHKKWGIIYKNYALARILPGTLDTQLEQLDGWIRKYEGEVLKQVLQKNQYRLIPENLVRYIESTKMAKPFLENYEVTAIGNNIIPDIIPDIIPWDIAGNYIGKKMSVEGKIVRTHHSGKACFLNFHNNWTRYFSLVIFGNVFHRFPEEPEKFYLNKFVRVKGKIKMYRGRAEMVLNSPAQIEIIANPNLR